MKTTKGKGDLGVVNVMADAMKRGYKVAIPMGENWPFDLIVLRNGKLERVQCKFTDSNGEYVAVRCRSSSEWVQYKYTAEMIDWIATYDRTSNRCYYVPSCELGEGRNTLHLRLTPARSNRTKGIRHADQYMNF